MAKKVIGINKESRSTSDARESDGWVAEKVNRKQFNQVLYQSITDHIWGTENQVKSSNKADIYTDGSGNPLDENDAAVIIGIDDRILINHDVTQTANLLLDCGGVKVNIEMYDGATLDMSTFDLTLGSTGDQIAGSIRVSGTGDLQVQESSGFRIEHDNMAISNLAGDIVVNNSDPAVSSANIDAKDLKIEYTSASTVTVTADSLKLVSDDNQSVVVNKISELFDTSTDLNSTPEKSDSWYDIWIGATLGGAIERKLVPVLEGTTTNTTTNRLVSSSASFVTDEVQIGDKAYNLTDGTFAFVTNVQNQNELILDDDIFTTGEDYRVELRSPTFSAGYSFHANVGSVENVSGNFNSSSILYFGLFTSGKEYTVAGGDFDITGNVTINTINHGIATAYQIDDGSWRLNFSFDLSTIVFNAPTFTITGVTFELNEAVTAANQAGGLQGAKTIAASGGIDVIASADATCLVSGSNIKLTSKPTWAD